MGEKVDTALHKPGKKNKLTDRKRKTVKVDRRPVCATIAARRINSLRLPLLSFSLLLCLTQHLQPSMSVTNSSAYRSERSFHQTSSSTTSSGNPYMEKSRGLFAEDFGSFMRPGSDSLGFSSKLEANLRSLAFVL